MEATSMCVVYKATEVRKNWSEFVDSAERVRPGFIQKTRDRYTLISDEMMLSLLSMSEFTAQEYAEDDGSVTLSLNEIDLAANAPNLPEARVALGNDILEYAEEYYSDFQRYSHSPNRSGHFPYVMKALMIGDGKKIGEELECQAGKN